MRPFPAGIPCPVRFRPLLPQDEADLLADNIVIMAGGRIRAQGSSLALKDSHGGAYTLACTLSGPVDGAPVDGRPAGAGEGEGEGKALLRRMARACALVGRCVRGARLARHVGTELVLKLPADESPRFARCVRRDSGRWWTRAGSDHHARAPLAIVAGQTLRALLSRSVVALPCVQPSTRTPDLRKPQAAGAAGAAPARAGPGARLHLHANPRGGLPRRHRRQ